MLNYTIIKRNSAFDSLKKNYQEALLQMNNLFAVKIKKDNPLYEILIDEQGRNKKILEYRQHVEKEQQNAQENYKQQGNYLIPRERYLKRKLAVFLAQAQTSQSVIVRGYEGEQALTPGEFTRRNEVHQMVSQLPIFHEEAVADMKNGHKAFKGFHKVHRCLTLEVPEAGIKGAIYFDIDVARQKCHIDRLGIDEQYQRKHFGSILLHTAIFIALHYQCIEISLHSTVDGQSFYSSQGFLNQEGEYILNFMEQQPEQFLSKIKLTCPHFNKNELNSLLLRDNLFTVPKQFVKLFELYEQSKSKQSTGNREKQNSELKTQIKKTLPA